MKPEKRRIIDRYEWYRESHNIRESIRLLAQDFSLSREAICTVLGLDAQYARDKAP